MPPSTTLYSTSTPGYVMSIIPRFFLSNELRLSPDSYPLGWVIYLRWSERDASKSKSTSNYNLRHGPELRTTFQS